MRHGFLSRGNERSPANAEMKSGPGLAIKDVMDGETLYRLSDIVDDNVCLHVHWHQFGH